MTRVNLYKVTYDETKAVALNQEATKDLFQEAVEEGKTVANVVTAKTLREALDKAEAQKLKYFSVSNVVLSETNVNLL